MIESSERSSSLRQREDIPQETRVIVMLGARMRDPKGDGGWQFPLLSPNQTNVGTSLQGEVSGGWSRMRAIQSEHRKTSGDDEMPKKLLVLVASGRAPDGTSKSKEATNTLVRKYGLPAESVVSICTSTDAGSTLYNAIGVADYIQSHQDTIGNVKNIEIVTNDYHMLRAWIMFSQGMLQRTAGKELEVSPEDKKEIRRILEGGSPSKEGWDPAMVRETRGKVMEILSPYFQGSKISVRPVVVEETLEADAETSPAKEQYARLLRNNRWVRETLGFEYKGVMDLLEGKYKGR